MDESLQNRTRTTSVDDKYLDEGTVRNKMKHMCRKPIKQHVGFYKEESDISLH